jgi:hypothetical protein
MILVELVNDAGVCLAAAMAEDGDFEHVGDIGELGIPVRRNRVSVVYRMFGLGDRANALDMDDWTAKRTVHAIRATRAGLLPAHVPQPEGWRFVALPREGMDFRSPAGALLIADEHLTPEEFDGAWKAWGKPHKPEPGEKPVR